VLVIGFLVIAGQSGGAPDAVRDGETGHVVDGTDVAAVALAIVELLEEPVRAKAMGAAGREWVEHEWTWDAAAKKLSALLGTS
jgi:phosphatidyl-myo-inositol dimannoside synthase